MSRFPAPGSDGVTIWCVRLSFITGRILVRSFYSSSVSDGFLRLVSSAFFLRGSLVEFLSVRL